MNKVRWAVRIIVIGVGLLAGTAWFAFSRSIENNSQRLANDILAAEAATYERQVHRAPTRPGTVPQCLDAILPAFVSVTPSLPQEAWDESRALCLGRLSLRPGLLLFESTGSGVRRHLGVKVLNCLHEARVAPGAISRFAEGRDSQSRALASIRVQMSLSDCFVVAEHLAAGRPGAALSECADAMAFYRDAALMGAGARVGDAAATGLPLAVRCGRALDLATPTERATFADELEIVRAGLPAVRDTADRQRVRLSLWRYLPFMSNAAKAKLPTAIRSDSERQESYAPFSEQLRIQLGWGRSDRILAEALASVGEPPSPAREAHLRAAVPRCLARALSRGQERRKPGD